MPNETVICGLCNNVCRELEVVLLRNNRLYYATRYKCPSCNFMSYIVTEPICGKESPERFKYFLSKAIDINK